MARVGFFAGSFDPPTLGHVELVRRALNVVDRLVVGIGRHAHKLPWLTVEQRQELLSSVLPDSVEVVVFDGLAVAAAREAGATLLLRGLRSEDDAASELTMARANACLDAGIETAFLASSPETTYISSRLVREVHQSGGDVSLFVPAEVAAMLPTPPSR
jgi:pantetheine-phosphate adenylyltransferase